MSIRLPRRSLTVLAAGAIGAGTLLAAPSAHAASGTTTITGTVWQQGYGPAEEVRFTVLTPDGATVRTYGDYDEADFSFTVPSSVGSVLLQMPSQVVDTQAGDFYPAGYYRQSSSDTGTDVLSRSDATPIPVSAGGTVDLGDITQVQGGEIQANLALPVSGDRQRRPCWPTTLGTGWQGSALGQVGCELEVYAASSGTKVDENVPINGGSSRGVAKVIVFPGTYKLGYNRFGGASMGRAGFYGATETKGIAAATPVTVAAGATAKVTPSSTPAGRIKGIYRDQTGKGIDGCLVEMIPTGSGRSTRATLTAPDGSFAVGGLDTSSYMLRINGDRACPGAVRYLEKGNKLISKASKAKIFTVKAGHTTKLPARKVAKKAYRPASIAEPQLEVPYHGQTEYTFRIGSWKLRGEATVQLSARWAWYLNGHKIKKGSGDLGQITAEDESVSVLLPKSSKGKKLQLKVEVDGRGTTWSAANWSKKIIVR